MEAFIRIIGDYCRMDILCTRMQNDSETIAEKSILCSYLT